MILTEFVAITVLSGDKPRPDQGQLHQVLVTTPSINEVLSRPGLECASMGLNGYYLYVVLVQPAPVYRPDREEKPRFDR